MDGSHPDSRGQAEVSGFRLVLADGTDPSAMRDELEEKHFLFGQTWKERRGNLVGSLEVQRNILMLVMIVIQCICIFIIYAVFSTLVVEKRHDIGVLWLGRKPSGNRRCLFIRRADGLCCRRLCRLDGRLGRLGPAQSPVGISGNPPFPQAIFYSPEAPISWNPCFQCCLSG